GDGFQSVFARTGRFFAIEHFGVTPDLITVAKSIAMGIPLSGVLGKAQIMDAPQAGGVGGTYVGNPVAQAAALAVLDVIEDEGLVERSAAIGETIRSRMLAWQQRWSRIRDVRGLGSMLANELDELVGTGGMSSVFRAHDRLLDRKVALKVLHQQYAADEEYLERFRREARSVAALSHPNIVTVIDRGDHEGRQFIVFEYIEGENLKRLIERRGPAPVATALELGMQMARGLSFAHQQGLVHRDVKPQNILLNGDGQAKVTDFGIARSMDVQHGMTQTGTVLGTSDYIAPEQAQGQRVDEHTDVY